MERLHRTRPTALRERVLQFGEGVFLRGFVDWMLDKINKEQGTDFGVVVVQPRAGGHCAELQAQDGLFTLCMHGNDDGTPREETAVVESVVRTVNPYVTENWMETLVNNPDLTFIVSNTTEAGIVYEKGNEATYPARLCRLLAARRKTGLPGFDVLPCELIDRNAEVLLSCVLKYAEDFHLTPEDMTWIRTKNFFHNTLVDRIVTGYPREDAQTMQEALGYTDACLDCCEWFHLWVIEGDERLAAALPFEKSGLSVVFTQDVSPYKIRKVRILNGAHTMMVPAAMMCGYQTVREAMQDEVIRTWLLRGLYEEIIPTMPPPHAGSEAFARDVLCRFDNPYIKHRLSAILMNCVSKWVTRILPTLTDYMAQRDRIPSRLCFSLAAMIRLYRTGISDDDPAVTAKVTSMPTAELLADTSLWGRDLSVLLPDVEAWLAAMEDEGVHRCLERMNHT